MATSTRATVSRKITRKESYGGSKQFLALLMGRFNHSMLQSWYQNTAQLLVTALLTNL